MKINPIIQQLNDKNYNVLIYRNSNVIKIINFDDELDFCIIDPSTIINNQISIQAGPHFNNAIQTDIQSLVNKMPIIYAEA